MRYRRFARVALLKAATHPTTAKWNTVPLSKHGYKLVTFQKYHKM